MNDSGPNQRKMAKTRPFVFPVLDAVHEKWQLVSQRACEPRAFELKKSGVWQCSTLEAQRAHGLADGMLLHCSVNGASVGVLLRYDDWFSLPWLQAMNGHDFESLPLDLRLILVNQHFHEVLHDLSEKVAGDVSVVNVSRVSKNSLQSWSHRLAISAEQAKDDGIAVRGWLFFSDDFLAHLVQWLKTWSANEKQTVRPVPDFSLPVAVARVRLTLAELKGLEPGDVVLLPVWQPEKAKAFAHGVHLALQERHGQYQIVTIDTIRDDGLHGKPVERADRVDQEKQVEDQQVDVDALAMEVEVVIGEVTMSLAELRALAPGDVLTLPQAADGTVQLRCNRRLIGQGQLVQVESCVGVRLSELY